MPFDEEGDKETNLVDLIPSDILLDQLLNELILL